MNYLDLKVYLSGPMTGVMDHNYPLFKRIATVLRKKGLYVYSPTDILPEGPRSEGSWAFYMSKALLMQLDANAWAGLPGWTKSKGAKREFDIACDLEYNLYLVRFSTQDIYLEEFS